ncbi:type IV secretion system protein VirB4 [Bacillus thuringiensis]|uniref:VirB4 family type IV secretion system protein n=1 Tax=Bacillus thuringiensis TaxID=1428 RepID=UPI002853DCD3|nr:type IV secretion system protein VirB4 [Bacillus thuringiensis]MDR5021422.1 type IV secretion system protein VirB4 [Bacillus thuringiensis]
MAIELANIIPMLNKNKKSTNKEDEKKQKRDLEFLAKIQPKGGLRFGDNFIRKGDGYETCIHVIDYPTNVDAKWMKKITTMRNVIVVTDVATMDRSETVTNINKSMLEQKMRFNNEKQGIAQIDAVQKHQELTNLYHQVSQLGEVIKLVHVRLYVHGKTTLELEKSVGNVLNELDAQSFKGTVLLNEQEHEWKSLFSPYAEQSTYANKREGKGMPGLTLAAGLPFHYAELRDPRGSYLGTTFTGGSVLFDLFHKDKKRRYYNGVIVGQMGSGKSTLLKKLFLDNKIRNNFIRGFDVTGEFEKLIVEVNGKMVALDGTQGLINPLQVYRSRMDGEEEKTLEDIETHSFLQHLSKAATFYRLLSPQVTDSDVQEYKKMLREFYESLGFLEKIKTTGITNLKNEEYPIFSELLEYVKKELYSDIKERIINPSLSLSRSTRLEKIELALDDIVNGYGHLFNGHTTLEDLTNEQVVFFSVKSLRSLEKKVFNAQMYNAFSLIWDHLIQIGEPQRKAIYQDGFDFDLVRRFLVILDESHLTINIENEIAVNSIIEFAREARKYFGGLLFASQSIRDFVPEVKDNEVASKIKVLFELTQYKFIMQQDANSLDTLRDIFQGQLSESELRQIPLLQQGESVLAINAVQNLTMTVEASEDELNLFEGGL